MLGKNCGGVDLTVGREKIYFYKKKESFGKEITIRNYKIKKKKKNSFKHG